VACGRNQEGKEARGLRHISEGQKGAAKKRKTDEASRAPAVHGRASFFYERPFKLMAERNSWRVSGCVLNDPNKQLVTIVTPVLCTSFSRRWRPRAIPLVMTPTFCLVPQLLATASPAPSHASE
jgi:hypothetical protein